MWYIFGNSVVMSVRVCVTESVNVCTTACAEIKVMTFRLNKLSLSICVSVWCMMAFSELNYLKMSCCQCANWLSFRFFRSFFALESILEIWINLSLHTIYTRIIFLLTIRKSAIEMCWCVCRLRHIYVHIFCIDHK